MCTHSSLLCVRRETMFRTRESNGQLRQSTQTVNADGGARSRKSSSVTEIPMSINQQQRNWLWITNAAVTAGFITAAIITTLLSSDQKHIHWKLFLPRTDLVTTEVREYTYVRPWWFLSTVMWIGTAGSLYNIAMYDGYVRCVELGHSSGRWLVLCLCAPVMTLLTYGILHVNDVFLLIVAPLVSIGIPWCLYQAEMTAAVSTDKEHAARDTCFNPMGCINGWVECARNKPESEDSRFRKPCFEFDGANASSWAWLAMWILLIVFTPLVIMSITTGSIQSRFALWHVGVQFAAYILLFIGTMCSINRIALWRDVVAREELQICAGVILIFAWWGLLFGGIPAGMIDE